MNKRWFELDLGDFLGEEEGPSLEKQFEERAVAWLLETFKGDCIHARADLDEEAYHTRSR